MTTTTAKPADATPFAAPSSPDLGTVYRLADHLDATLAMAEDLMQQSLELAPLASGDETGAITSRNAALCKFARATRAMELGITARLLQARARAVEVRHAHPRFEPLIALFIGGTAPLTDAIAHRSDWLGDISETALSSGPDLLQFFVSRGLVEDQTRSLSSITKLQVTDAYFVARSVHLGALMDMVAQFLDALDLAFDLYAEPRDTD